MPCTLLKFSQQITKCYISEGRTLHNHYCENLKFYIRETVHGIHTENHTWTQINCTLLWINMAKNWNCWQLLVKVSYAEF
jgi:cytosine/uracil/thiamine/allantoin permease